MESETKMNHQVPMKMPGITISKRALKYMIISVLIVVAVIFAVLQFQHMQENHDAEIIADTSNQILSNIIDVTSECKSISMTYENKSATIVALECLEEA